MSRNSFVAVFLSLLVISSAVAPSLVSADHEKPDCREVEEGLWSGGISMVAAFWSGDIYSWGPDGEPLATCIGQKLKVFHSDYSLNESQDTKETKIDIHANARLTHDKSVNFQDTFSNYAKGSRNIAWVKAKNATIQELNSGGSESSAKTRAKAAIQDYYSLKQMQLINQWNSTVLSMKYHQQVVDNDTNIDRHYVNFTQSGIDSSSWEIRFLGVQTKSVTLVNGSTRDVLAVNWKNWHSTGECTRVTHVNSSPTCEASGTSYGWHKTDVKPPDSNYDTILYASVGNFTSRFRELHTQSNQMTANSDQFVSDTYAQYNEGDLNSSDLVDPYVMAQDFATQYNSSGYYVYYMAEMALIGHSVTGFENHSVMNVSVNVTWTDSNGNVQNEWREYQGLVGSTSPQLDKLNTSQQYDAPNQPGSFYLITTDGERIQIEDEFNITTAYDRNGNELQNVTFRAYNYQTSNSSELESDIQALLDLREQVNSAEPGGASSSGVTPAMAGGIAVVLVAVAYLARDN